MDNFTVLSIPEISNERQIWLIRTNGGLYYNDFTTNKYVALGWDAVSVDLLLNSSISNDAKKEKINELYPDEKRPGLIFSQLYNFHCVMNNGDLVLIPSEGTKFIRVGILGETVEEVSHINNSNEEYAVCSYTHKRKVKWFSEIDVSRDIYLSKIMKVQQTISNITKYADYIYRNIYSCYIVDDFIHLSLQKTSSSDLEMKSNVELQASILEIVDIFYELYGEDESYKKITIKTAVGSPGFIEVILNYAVPTTFSVIFIVNTVLGKLKDSDGSTKKGIIGLIDEINKLRNDYIDRKKKIAETKVIEENIQLDKELKQAQIDKISAETRKINAEADALEQSLIPSSQKIEKAVEDLEKTSKKLKDITDKNSIECHKNIDLAS